MAKRTKLLPFWTADLIRKKGEKLGVVQADAEEEAEGKACRCNKLGGAFVAGLHGDWELPGTCSD